MDIWDPNNWNDNHEHRIYAPPPNGREPFADSCFPRYGVVSPEDYAWACQWCWSPLRSKGKADKFYLRRAVTVSLGDALRKISEGGRIQARRTENLFLHVAILTERMGVHRPSDKHVAGHLNDNSWDCQRHNLAWITASDNAKQAWASGAKTAWQQERRLDEMAQDFR